MKVATMIAVILICSTAIAQDQDKEYISAATALRDAKISKIQTKLDLAKQQLADKDFTNSPGEKENNGWLLRANTTNGTGNPKTKPKSKTQIQRENIAKWKAAIADFDKQIADIKNGPLPVPPLLYSALAVGKVGKPSANGFKVQQVVDENNMLVEWEIVHDTRWSVGGQRGGNFFISNETTWIKQPTAGLVDGKPIQLSGAYKVTGTKKYRTTDGGGKTVFVLEPKN